MKKKKKRKTKKIQEEVEEKRESSRGKEVEGGESISVDFSIISIGVPV